MAANNDSFFSNEEFTDILIKMSYLPMDAKKLYKIALDYDDSKYYYAYITDNLKYASIGYSYLSADGDFKDIYINVEKTKKIMLNKENIDLYTQLEKETISYFKKQDATIIAPKPVTDHGLETFLLIMSFFMCEMNALLVKNSVRERHVHPFYKDRFNDVSKRITDLHRSKDPKYLEYTKLFREIIKESDDLKLGIIYGQKICPIKVKEINNFKNPSYQLWRELLVNKHIILLSLNNMTRGLCALRYYYFIRDDFSIYNNYLIFNKVFKEEERKPLANDIILLSDTLDKEKFSSECASKKEPPKNQWVDIHLVQIFNNVGTTYYSKLMVALMGNESLSTPVLYDIGQFKKYIFEFIWNFMCINKLGVVHGDCHLNNITIQHHAIKSDDPRTKGVKFTIKDETYVFEYKAIGTLIDFSRCWFFEKNSIEENNKLSSPFQIENIVNKYYCFFPDFVDEYDEKLRGALMDRHDEVLNILSVLDAYSVVNATHIVLKTSLERYEEGGSVFNIKSPINKHIKFVGKIVNNIKTILTEEMGLYLDGKLSAEDMGYPLHRIITTAFKNNLELPTSNYKDYMFVDHLYYCEKMEYKLSDMYKYGVKKGVIDDKKFKTDYKNRMITYNNFVKTMTVIAEN